MQRFIYFLAGTCTFTAVAALWVHSTEFKSRELHKLVNAKVKEIV